MRASHKVLGLCTPLHNQKLADEGLTLLDGMLLYVKEDWTASKNKSLLRPVALKLIDAAPHNNDIDTIKRLAVRHLLEIIPAAASADPQVIELYTYCSEAEALAE